MGAERQPWEQRDDEPPVAYAAFVVYRDMGTRRGVVEAYRQKTGKPAAKQATGTWNAWAKDFTWADRARAYDQHEALLKQQAADQVTVKRARIWAEREGRQLEDDYRLGRRLVQQAATISEMPVVRQTVAGDGVTTIYEPVDLKDIAAAAAIAEKGRAMAWAAIDRGLGHENADAIERAKGEAAARPAGDVSASQRNLEAWRAAQRQHMLTYDATRPPGEAPGPDPEPEPDPARRNGSGVPPVPASAT